MKRIKLIIGSVVTLVVLAIAGHSLAVNAATDNRPNCGTSAVIKCGVWNQSDLTNGLKSDSKALYKKYGVPTSLSGAKTGTLKANGDIVVSGKVVATNAQTFGRTSANGGTKVSVGGTTFYKHSSRAAFPNDTTVYVFFNSDGTFKAAIAKVCGNPLLATPKPKPVYACSSLTATAIDRDSYKFTTKASASNGAKIVSYTYDFGDGSKQTTGATVSHNYAKAGTYTAKVTVNFTVDGKATSKSCTTKVTVCEAPVYACDTLQAKQIDRTTYTYTTKASAKNGASISNYSYDFGDGSKQTAGATVKHSYAKPGTYTVKVSVNVKVNGKSVTAPSCTTKVTVKPEMCEVKGKEQYEKGDKRCVEDKPSVSIEKTVNGKEFEQVDVNQQFEYEITVKNTGNTTLKNLKVTDPAPAGITMISADKGDVANNSWSYTIPSLAVGKSATFTIQAKYPAYEAGTQVNTACVDTKEITPSHPQLCDTASTSTHEDIQVCDTDDNTVKTIDRSDFDESHQTTDLSKCEETPTAPTTPTTPTELPHTGVSLGLGSLIGAGSLTGVALAYVASRRNLR